MPHRPWIDATEARARLALGERRSALELARRAVGALESHHPPHLAELWVLRAHAETSAAVAAEDGAFAEEAERAEEALRERGRNRAAALPERFRASFLARPELA
ncbi:MAG: hypothetical protein R3B99_22580 [Polyangiales bacterium]